MKRQRQNLKTLPEKANKILNGILVVLILIAIKIWHLTVIQHEKKMEEAKRPQRRVVVERSDRANIYDRFNIPLASNKVQYYAAVSYGPIRDLPRSSWKKDETGKRRKYLFRKEYITQLAQKLAKELDLDAVWIEDMIHAKASILGNVPCILKKNISETQYFKLKMLEKDWPGIQADIGASRCYPLGSVGGELIGYIGPISQKEYESIMREMGELREWLAAYEEGEIPLTIEGYDSIEAVSTRLEELEKKAYHINDSVGKAGVEAAFDETLRGVCGKRMYVSDIKGNFLRELPYSEKSLPGSRLVLSISSELQAYAEQLLAEYENEPASAVPLAKKPLIPPHQPWMKGGAIIALDPNNGEVYAMASFPCFDPNDFIRSGDESESIEKNLKVNKWFETEEYIAQIWNMKIPYVRQRFDNGYYEESLPLSWENYLSFILPTQSEIVRTLEKKSMVKDAIFVQMHVEKLLELFRSKEITIADCKIFDLLYRESDDIPVGITISLPEKAYFEKRLDNVKEEVMHLKRELTPYFSLLHSNYDKLLLVDLYRIAVDSHLFTPVLADLLGLMTLDEYREASACFVCVTETVREIVKAIFLENDFTNWRETYFQDYLADRRKEEKERKKKYARPYIEYLEKAQKELFAFFWEKYLWEFMTFFLTGEASPLEKSGLPYKEILAQWSNELHNGAHKGLDWVSHYNTLRKVTDEMDPLIVIDFLKTLRSFQQLNRPLIGRYSGLKGSREKDLAATFYPSYGFGYARSHAFRQAATVGSIFKLVPAYEALRQKYLKLKERGESLSDLNPLTIIDDKHRIYGKNEWNVGFTHDGKPIPMFYRGGRLPRSEHAGVGKIDLIKALEASSNPYFAILSGDILEDPEDLCHAANLLGFGEKTGIDLPCEYGGRLPVDVAYNRTGLYSMSIGQHSMVGTPLQTAVMLALIANGGKMLKPQILKEKIFQDCIETIHEQVRWHVFMPRQIQNILLTGMRQVVMGEKGTARLIRQHYDYEICKQIIGKTSTSEVIERMSLDAQHGQMKLKHVWFGGIAYETKDFSKPELIVVVYLRYGGWGKEAAPLAVEIVKKWRELKKRYSSL